MIGCNNYYTAMRKFEPQKDWYLDCYEDRKISYLVEQNMRMRDLKVAT